MRRRGDLAGEGQTLRGVIRTTVPLSFGLLH